MLKELEKLLHSEIPLTKSIGVRVQNYEKHSLTLSAPLENNINHKNTAFGGSLYCVSVLSGWGLIHLLLKEHNLSGHIVIQESNTKFIKPVTSDIHAQSSFKSTTQYENFLGMYRRKGISRIKLKSVISCNSEICVQFEGRYVIHT